MNEKTNAIPGCQTARIAQNAAPWSAAYVCDVWCYDFGANSGKQLLWGCVSGRLIQVTLFCAGIGTLFFHLMAKLKVPAFWDLPLPFGRICYRGKF